MDEISISTHTDQAVSLLGENISLEEKAVLGGCEWSANEAVVHYDEDVRLSLFFFCFLVFWSLLSAIMSTLEDEDVRIDEMYHSLCQRERRHGLVSVKSCTASSIEKRKLIHWL